MTYTNADMASHFSNASLLNKLSTSLKSYMKAYAATIPTHTPWHQNPSRRVLLADHGRRLPRFCQKMHTLPETWQPHPRKTEQLHSILSPWPFTKWRMDILGHFSPGKGQVKFLIVVVDYFTKWIEAKPLATITTQQVQQFVWKDIIWRYGVPHTTITDNGRQFIDKRIC